MPTSLKTYTKLAIREYKKMAKHERKAEEAEMTLAFWLTKVTDNGQLDLYIQKTNEIQKEQDSKMARFVTKHTKGA